MLVIKNDIDLEIINLRTRVFVEEQNVPPYLEIQDNENEYKHCCLYYNDKLVSYLRFNINQDNVAHIGRVCVDIEYRSKHYGKEIMLLVEDEIKRLGCFKIELGAQLQAVGFYEKLGYKKQGKIFLEALIEHIMMIKNI